MLIIPAIDILDGKLVRLEKGDYQTQKIYSDNPFEVAKQFAELGFDFIHIVDLSGSKDGRINSIELLKKIKLDDVIKLIDCGVDQIVIGSISITNKNEFRKIVKEIGSEKIVAAIDSVDGLIKVKGWTEQTNITIENHVDYCLSLNVNTFLCTDIKKDGMLTGPNINLYKNLMVEFPSTKIIASGGIGRIEDVKELKKQNLYAVVIGKAIYENKINLKELAKLAC
jgi:phosphoribosylformimino-5-aminoimidazole carboxamide ribotide isomerase